MSDEMKAGIFCFTWEMFMYLGLIVELITGSSWGWYIFLLDTAVQLTILYYDYKLEKAESRAKRTKNYLSRLSSEFVEYVQTHSNEDNDPAKIIEVNTRKGRKHKKIRKVS